MEIYFYAETIYKIKLIQSKHFLRANRKKKQHRPSPGTLQALPDYLLCFSAIQILWWYYKLWLALAKKKTPTFSFDFKSFNLHLLFKKVTGILSFRRPPDLFIQTENIILQVQQHSWSSLFLSSFPFLSNLSYSFSPTAAFINKAKEEIWNQESILHSLAAGREVLTDKEQWSSDSRPIVIDSATSKTITPYLSDLMDPEPYKVKVAGIGKGTITHKGKIKWAVLTDDGKKGYLEDHEAYYCEQAPYRLLCPHSWKKCQDEMRFAQGETEGDNATFMLASGNAVGYVLVWNRGKTSLQVPLDPNTNLPTIGGYGSFNSFESFANAFVCLPTVIPDGDQEENQETMQMEGENKSTEPTNFQLTTNQHEKEPTIDEPITRRDEALFLSWHIKLGHLPFSLLRWLATLGLIPKRLRKCRNLVCPACMYGKQRRKPWRTKGKVKTTMRRANQPGECVSVDQLVSQTPGLIGQTTGKLTTSRYHVATVFVDHYSRLDFVYLQESTSADETIEAKNAFERFAAQRGVTIRHYHADNGIFASNGFREAVRQSGQTISFCGVGAHHQNGIAERRIQDLTQTARSQLAHASHRNPAVTAHLWPFALAHASYVRRLIPREAQAKSPEELFSRTPVRPTTKHLHVFGCPVYVLKGKLQSGGSIPKWDDRARQGIYLGHSRQHAASVSLVLNPKTGYVSPQFHCVYDDAFDSVKNDENFSTTWATKAGLIQNAEDDDYRNQVDDWQASPPYTTNETQSEEQSTIPTQINDVEGNPTTSPDSASFQEPATQQNETTENEGATVRENVVTTRSGRRVRPPQRYVASFVSAVTICVCVCMSIAMLDDQTLNNVVKLFAYPASIADNDTMYLREAMQQEDRAHFLEAMVKEISDHTKRGHWRITTKEEMKRKGYHHRPIMAVWSFKRKRNPMGDIIKYKARLCCHGGQTIKGIHYNETFSPVVGWSTIRLLLTMSIIHGWHARQIDFVLAFPQAKVRTDIYMHLPEKFRVKNGKMILDEEAPHPSKQNEVVKLIQNVYGLADASYTWHLHVKRGLLSCGFKQSKVDPCLFYKKDMLFILYVDDAICLTSKKNKADELIVDLQKLGYSLTDEGSMSAYLGLQVDWLKDGKVSLTQPAFIERIIKTCGLKDQRMHDTPADVILHRDSDGLKRKNEFHYRSVIGQLNYLAATTRPEIQFAVHQCARFCQDPKMVHEKAVKRIVRYLKRTKDKGLILSVDKTKGIECFVDADFAGGMTQGNTTNPRDCLSRTGYVVKYAGCPIVWASKLQTLIALSTTEAEYLALSTAMREVIFLKQLMEEMAMNDVEILQTDKPVINVNVYEDNVGAIELAKLPKLRPRTKHIGIQFHHFRSWTCRGINGEEPRILVKHITTQQQQADIFTKPLARTQFQHLRWLLCGW